MHTRVMLPLFAAALLALAGCSDGEQPPAPGEGAGEGAGEAGGESTMQMIQERTQDAMHNASEAVTRSPAEAESLIDRAQAYLAENNLDSAKGIMDKLNELGHLLSEATKAQVDKLQEQIDALREQQED